VNGFRPLASFFDTTGAQVFDAAGVFKVRIDVREPHPRGEDERSSFAPLPCAHRNPCWSSGSVRPHGNDSGRELGGKNGAGRRKERTAAENEGIPGMMVFRNASRLGFKK
jgi:hypothetical protein